MGAISDIAAGTLIGFTGNKTKAEAVKDTTTNRVDICKTKELYFNGERLGVTDVEKQFLENNLNADGTVKAAKVKTSAGSDIETYVKNNIVGAYKFKSTVASISEILALACSKGDVFNVTEDFTLNGQSFSDGTNVAVNTAFAAGAGKEENLDALGGVTIDTSHFANIYKYDYSVLPIQNNMGSTDSGLSKNQLDGLKSIAQHLVNEDLVLITDSTNFSLGNKHGEVITKYTAKYNMGIGLGAHLNMYLSFEYNDKSYLIDCSNDTWMINIGNSESARLLAVEKQLQLV